jgi:hypothetical protein
LVYDPLRNGDAVAATELTDAAIKANNIASEDRATRREFTAKFHNLLRHRGRRGQLDKVVSGPGAKWRIAETEPGLI